MLKNKPIKLLFIVIFFKIQSSGFYIEIIKENKHTGKILFSYEKQSTIQKKIVFNQKHCLNFSDQNKYYFYKKGLLQYYSIALQVVSYISAMITVILKEKSYKHKAIAFCGILTGIIIVSFGLRSL